MSANIGKVVGSRKSEVRSRKSEERSETHYLKKNFNAEGRRVIRGEPQSNSMITKYKSRELLVLP
jgi:hypothetical protein